MPRVDAITRRWTKTTADERAVSNGCRFDLAAGEHVCEFFRGFLRHSIGQWAGQPFELLDWQRNKLILPLFGWKRADGTRRYRRAHIAIPKKNGKSSLASGISLYLLCADDEPGAHIYAAGADRINAGIIFNESVRMVKASDALSAVLVISESSNTISYPETNSFYRALSKESGSAEGLNIHGLLFDELHVQKSRKFFDTLRYGLASRRQPLSISITTAGDSTTSICKEQHDYAESVANGVIEDQEFFALLYGADRDDDWSDPKIWKKANPSLGTTITLDSFAADFRAAQKTPAAESSFRRYRLNQWATGESVWMKSSDWQACKADFKDSDLVGLPCFAGLDLAKTKDTTACTLAFKGPNEEVFLLAYTWLPEDTAKAFDHMVPYSTWARQGFLELTPGNVCDYSIVERRIAELHKRFNIQRLAFDPYMAEMITQRLEVEHGIERTAFGQTVVNYAGPSAEFERLLLSKKLKHNGNPVLTWQAGNVQVKTDLNNNKRPCKAKEHDPRKVDAITAAIMGLAMLMEGSAEPPVPRLIILG